MGEFDLIARLAAILGSPGAAVLTAIGDDAAVLAPDLVVTTDLVVEDVHVRRSTSSVVDIGWKALAVNLSDLAAMGAWPVAAVVALGLGPGFGDDDAAALYEGLRACADTYGCPVVGGDVSRAAQLVVAVTVIGRAADPRLRSGARAGDVVAVTGSLGGSEAGRLLLEGLAVASPHEAELVARHRRPLPLLVAGQRLAGVVHAMLDVSDGVASDARRLAEASGVAVEIDLDALPLQAGVQEVAAAAGRLPGVFAASGGEDYELLVALPSARLDPSLTAIGRVRAGEPAVTFVGAGAVAGLAGYDHREVSS